MDLRIRKRKAILAGASAGLGFASALALAREGVDIVISARGKSKLEDAAQRIINETGANIVTVVADHGTGRGRAALLAACPDPDILVITCSPPKTTEDYREIDEVDWHASVATTLVGPIELMKAVIDSMAARRWGRIVNIATGAAKHPLETRLLSGPTRSALVNYTVAISKKVAKHNVIINNLLPGFHETSGLRDVLTERANRAGTSYEDELTGFLERTRIPLGRLCEPNDFAAFCALLCSEYAASVVGQSLVIDGGFTHSLF